MGKCENGAKRYGASLMDFAKGLFDYLQIERDEIHPTHKLPGEKKVVRNKKSITDKQKMTRARATMKREAKVSAKL